MIWIVLFILFVVLAFLFWAVAFRANHRLPELLLAYHHVEEKRGFPATRISRAQFESQITTLKEQGYHSAGLDRLLSPERKDSRTVCITFDDSYESVVRNALPFLKSTGYSATLFIISDFLGRPASWDVAIGPDSTHMSEDQVRAALEDGFTIGSHTRTHPDLTVLSEARLKDELLNSKKALEDKFGVAVPFLAYPFGRYNTRVKEAVRACGYQAAFTINRPLFQKSFDPFAVPVTGIYSVDSLTTFLIKAERNGFVWVEDIKDKIINRFASGSALVKGNRAS